MSSRRIWRRSFDSSESTDRPHVDKDGGEGRPEGDAGPAQHTESAPGLSIGRNVRIGHHPVVDIAQDRCREKGKGGRQVDEGCHAAQEEGEAPSVTQAGKTPESAWGLGLLAAAISTSISAIAAGVAVAIVGSAAMGAVAERPEVMGRSIIFVGLAEGIAIYGLIISIMILSKLQ